VHYIDTANYEPRDVAKFEYHWQWAYQDKFKNAGLTAAVGCGFDPGGRMSIRLMPLKHHSQRSTRSTSSTATRATMARPLPPISIREINLREVTANGRYWENGRWVETKPLEIKRSFPFPEGSAPRTSTAFTMKSWSRSRSTSPCVARASDDFGDNYIKAMEVL